jgi:hypothetical protein
MSKERILITVKTYPSLSSKYDEVVCTAGLREDGTWVRIYPIPFRKLEEIEQYSKFNIVEVELTKNTNDPRPESYRLKSGIKIVGELGVQNDWFERRHRVLTNSRVFNDFDFLIAENKSEVNTSLATFKPTQIIDFEIESDTPEWDSEKLEKVRLRSKQNSLFEDNDKVFTVVRKLPYKFKYVFNDINGHTRKLTISDWEIGALFWRMKKKFFDDKIALEHVKNKYFKELTSGRDIHFFVGTTQSWDSQNAPNPFMIIGVFSPPIILQNSLF